MVKRLTTGILPSAGHFSSAEAYIPIIEWRQFFELDMLASHQSYEYGTDSKSISADGVIAGFEEIDGRQVAIYARNLSFMGGTYGEMHGRKVCAHLDTVAGAAYATLGSFPCVRLWAPRKCLGKCSSATLNHRITGACCYDH